MGCCGPDRQEEPKKMEEKEKKRDISDEGGEDEGEHGKNAKNIRALGLSVILIAGLLAWLL